MIGKLCQSAWRYITAPIGKTSNEFAAEIKEELTFHIEQRALDFERQGFERSEAEAAAIAKFGDVSKIAAQCHAAATAEINWMHRVHLIVTAVLAFAVFSLFGEG